MASKALKHIAMIGGGTASAQAVTILVTPLLSRLYHPEAYAVFGLLTSYVSILAVLNCLRLDQAILVAKNRTESVQLRMLAEFVSQRFLLLSSVLAVAGWAVFGYSPYYILAPLTAYASTGLSIAQQFQLKSDKTRSIFRILLLRSLGVVLFQVLLFWMLPSLNGLVFGQVAGFMIAFAAALLIIRRESPRQQEERTFSKMDLLRKYMDFPKYNAPHALFSAVSLNMPTIALGLIFPIHLVGFYIMAEKIMKLPIAIVSQAVRQSLTREFSETGGDRRRDQRLLFKFTALMVALAAVPILLVIFWGPALFGLVLGQHWADAGKVASTIAVWMLLIFINAPSAAYIIGIRKTYWLTATQFVDVVLKALYLSWVYWNGISFEGAVFGIAVVSSLYNLLIIVYAVREVRREKIPA